MYEITKLIKCSPKRDVIFQKIKDEVSLRAPGVRVLCPTRWTVRAEALTTISENCETLQLTWEVARETTRETEMRSRIDGVSAQMRKFDFFFGVELSRRMLNMVGNLSRALQAKTITANQGLVSMTLQALQSIRKDESFQLFWDYLQSRRSKVDVSSPVLPRRRKMPKQFEVGSSTPEYPTTVQDYFRRTYFEALDLVIESIRRRFDQKGYYMLQKLEMLLTYKSPMQS